MLKSVIELACALLCASSMLVQVADAATCPADNVVAPCTCSLLGNDAVSLNCNNKGLTDARIDLILEVFAKDPTMGPLGPVFGTSLGFFDVCKIRQSRQSIFFST